MKNTKLFKRNNVSAGDNSLLKEMKKNIQELNQGIELITLELERQNSEIIAVQTSFEFLKKELLKQYGNLESRIVAIDEWKKSVRKYEK